MKDDRNAHAHLVAAADKAAREKAEMLSAFGCTGNCSQGRKSCDCEPAEPPVFGFTARGLALAVVLVLLAAGVSSYFPMGWAVALP